MHEKIEDRLASLTETQTEVLQLLLDNAMLSINEIAAQEGIVFEDFLPVVNMVYEKLIPDEFYYHNDKVIRRVYISLIYDERMPTIPENLQRAIIDWHLRGVK